MKVILSRKGFDSKYGGIPSPIMPDGTLLSMPIPYSHETGITFEDLCYGEETYLDILSQLAPNRKNGYKYCHLDPDIRKGVRVIHEERWEAAFGQAGAAQTHLANQNVKEGDLFLFFGWFRQTKINENNELKYIWNAPHVQAIYGYLHVGEIISTRGEIEKYNWHPHAGEDLLAEENNALYLATKQLVINNQLFPGYGTLNYQNDCVLTAEGETRSRWKKELPWVANHCITITHHDESSIKPGYFQSVPIGQEFVISKNEEVTKWALNIIEKGVCIK